MNRRNFLAKISLGLVAAPSILARSRHQPERLVLLHTNDTHSRLDPFPMDGGKLQGLGGVARRKTLIDQIRRQEQYVLLLDSGDMFQGTPYYNLYGGVPELEAMTEMGYDVATLGNHEFDNGIKGFASAFPHGKFDWVSSNLDWSGTTLANNIKPWTIKTLGPFKVGIFGVLCQFEGMVAPHNHQGVQYMDPIISARKSVAELKSNGCNLIICLSHMGFATNGPNDEMRDDRFAQHVDGIDVILGGHSHTFIDELKAFDRKGGGTTYVSQQGWGGVRLGRINVEQGRKDLTFSQHSIPVIA